MMGLAWHFLAFARQRVAEPLQQGGPLAPTLASEQIASSRIPDFIRIPICAEKLAVVGAIAHSEVDLIQTMSLDLTHEGARIWFNEP
jgi:hypothetical protein